MKNPLNYITKGHGDCADNCVKAIYELCKEEKPVIRVKQYLHAYEYYHVTKPNFRMITWNKVYLGCYSRFTNKYLGF